MPRLWTETIYAHRREVREAILETTAALVAQHGLAAVTMSQIAENTGIGRATLYKYFPDVEAILMEWHQRHVTRHLELLARHLARTALTVIAQIAPEYEPTMVRTALRLVTGKANSPGQLK